MMDYSWLPAWVDEWAVSLQLGGISFLWFTRAPHVVEMCISVNWALSLSWKFLDEVSKAHSMKETFKKSDTQTQILCCLRAWSTEPLGKPSQGGGSRWRDTWSVQP